MDSIAGKNVQLDIFSTCPQSSRVERTTFVQNVVKISRWCESNGLKGILIYTDNSLVDPWLVAQIVIQSTKSLCPLIAVQPVYMHPYNVANLISSFAFLYGRQIYMNMVAGGFKNDLLALNDLTPHDKRYDRLIEYTTIIKALLVGGPAVNYQGDYYKVKNLKLNPPMPHDLMPGIFVSGSSTAGTAAARAIGATSIMYPQPAQEYQGPSKDEDVGAGIRIGIITRASEYDAWAVAYERFPEDRKGRLTHQLAMKTSDSEWHHQLSSMGEKPETASSPYWLVPFLNYKTFCPYLVGSYDRVATEISRYIQAGFRTFILDIPYSEEELQHTRRAFSLAKQGLTQGDVTSKVADKTS